MTDDNLIDPATPEAPETNAMVHAAKSPEARSHIWRTWLPTRTQMLVAVIGLLCASQTITLVRLHRLARPVVMTVGVREMTQNYLAKIARGTMSPQEAAIRTELFLSVSQDILHHVAARQGVLVLARECVLAGEHGDATAEIEARVERELAKSSANVVTERAPPPRGVTR